METKQTVPAGSSQQNQPPSAITWYACGQVLPLPTDATRVLERMVWEQVKKYTPNLVPTTYDAADAYLRQERKKPEGERDLLREMCMMIPLGLSGSPKISFVSSSMKIAIALTNGSLILVPTIDVPPDSFGTPETVDFLDSSMLKYEPPTNELQKGRVLLTYWTKIGKDSPAEVHEGVGVIQLNMAPYA